MAKPAFGTKFALEKVGNRHGSSALPNYLCRGGGQKDRSNWIGGDKKISKIRGKLFLRVDVPLTCPESHALLPQEHSLKK